MSKITDYQELMRIKTAEADRQSVREFALELKKPTKLLLKQLQEAKVPKESASEILTHADKAVFLRYLQKQYTAPQRRKRITISIETQEQKLIQSIIKQENGAEWEALRYFAEAVIFGNPIEPTFKKMVNLIMAKTVLIGTLPSEKLGRPKREDLDSLGLEAAHRYWEMVDSGVGYEKAVEILSNDFHKSERHIMRLIAKHKHAIGETPEIRSKNREWHDIMHRMYQRSPSILDSYKALCEPIVPFPELSLDDYLEHLAEMARSLAADIKPLTKNI